jgi:hypothetical protein
MVNVDPLVEVGAQPGMQAELVLADASRISGEIRDVDADTLILTSATDRVVALSREGIGGVAVSGGPGWPSRREASRLHPGPGEYVHVGLREGGVVSGEIREVSREHLIVVEGDSVAEIPAARIQTVDVRKLDTGRTILAIGAPLTAISLFIWISSVGWYSGSN